MPFMPPLTPPPKSATEFARSCARCGHIATYHRKPVSHHPQARCKFRQTWRHLWSRCPCQGYVPPGLPPETVDNELRRRASA